MVETLTALARGASVAIAQGDMMRFYQATLRKAYNSRLGIVLSQTPMKSIVLFA